MGKKDKKKGKGAEKTLAKTEKKYNQKLKKELAQKGEEDIESLLAKFAEEEQKKTTVLEELVPAPSKRSAFSLTPHPDKDQLILFGGEYFNGSKTFMYNDLYFYSMKQDRWTKVTAPGGPPPRSSHQAVALAQGGGQLWIFGGEFTSLSQSQFYHYKDLWVFHFKDKKWEKAVGTGHGPSSRSGHRMVGIKKQLFIFGGFHDNLRDYKYFNDIYIFNLETYSWKKIEAQGNGPCPRSGCQMMPLADGRILIYGGYSKEKIKKDVDKGVMQTDMYLLSPDKHDTSGTKWKWQSVKQSGIRPSIRCAFSMAPTITGDKAYLFGGVLDAEDEEELEGTFYNDLYQLDLTKGLWHQVQLSGKKEDGTGDIKRRRNKDNDEMAVEEKLETMSVEEAKQQIVSDDGVFTVSVGPSIEPSSSGEENIGAQCKDIFIPPPRINAGLAIKKGIIYLYGGMYEDGDKQLTLNDFYYLDVNKLDEWQTIIALKPEDLEWFDSESESDDEDDEDEDSSESSDEQPMDVDS